MEQSIEICSLDYLIGTLATAYKGLITSLVVKDFCITGEGKKATLKGAVISMPAGDYQASLIESGIELSRDRLKDGRFELAMDAGRLKKTGSLQIDIIQNGRHIGTFLLKREDAGGFYTPALELSEELRGLDLKTLTSRLKDRPGLLRKAEGIISKILSTKKDWVKLPEELNGFATDLFWSERDTFYASFELIARFSIRSAEKTGSEKTLENFLDLISLPVERETDGEKLRGAVDIWLAKLRHSTVNLSLSPKHALGIMERIHRRDPGAKINPAMSRLVHSLAARVEKAPALDEQTVGSIRGLVPDGDLAMLEKFSSGIKEDILQDLSRKEALIEKKGYAGVFADADAFAPDILDSGMMIDEFFRTAARNMNSQSAEALYNAFLKLFGIYGQLDEAERARAVSWIPEFLGRLLLTGRPELCLGFLHWLKPAPEDLRTEVVMGTETASLIIGSGDAGLISAYKEMLRKNLIPAAKSRGVSTETWAEMVNPMHLRALSRFLEILGLGADELRDILLHVICNLYVSGVFIPDDRIFQRQVSAYLNSNAMRGDFVLNYMLLKKLPAYFNEVGATSVIRDYTTEIDSWGNDPVLYFLRKQTHVNASNYNIQLTEAVISSWALGSPAPLEAVVPPEIFESAKAGLIEKYHPVMKGFLERANALVGEGVDFKRVPGISAEQINRLLEDVVAPEEIRSKTRLLIRIYQEIVKKYALRSNGAFGAGGARRELSAIIEKIKELKKTVLSPEKTEAQETLFFKRHIAFGIPSVLGSYHEPKFDALGDIFRGEEKLRLILEDIITAMETGHSPEEDSAWLPVFCIGILGGLFRQHGLENQQMDEALVILNNDRLRLSQLADMLGIIQKELAWAVKSLNMLFREPLANVLNIYPADELPEHLSALKSGPGFLDKAADIVIRDMITGITGLAEADRLIVAAKAFLQKETETSSDRLFNAGKPIETRPFYVIDELTDLEAMRLAPAIGGKAKNLVYLGNRGFFAVPQGAVFSSAHTDNYIEYTQSGEFKSALREAVKEIELRTGHIFGSGENPLFLSVRSGSYLSMPGILASVLYCGMNRLTLQGMIKKTGSARLAWDSMRRSVEHYAQVVLGLESTVFENIKNIYAKEKNLERIEDLDAGQMEELVSLYRNDLSARSLNIPEDPYRQLEEAVRGVYASWFSEKAGQFRSAVNMSPYWGTAVTLMRMIYGNDDGAGSSVFFTRNPFSFESEVYGETREKATGDELVYGMRTNMPILKKQAGKGRKSLEETDPELFSMHSALAMSIERSFGGLPQEVEATYVTKKPGGKRVIYVLQARRMEFGGELAGRFDEICQMESKIIGRGVGGHGGALSGVACLAESPSDIEGLKEETGLPVILIRRTASTGDVALMPLVSGIITSMGGVTSHAAVLAQKFGLTAVLSCPDLEFGVDEKGNRSARIGDFVVKDGTRISIDGSTGLVFSGVCLHISRPG
ncbi:MAG: PEP-utilizing enzyme [Nitrospiraceae bacterium]|nr:PEP-utilizing enzyme [Nitrospiraceae bacterium]